MKTMKLNIQLFGHTNETTNYDLPQFVGTDKPTWLGDFNTAMSTIDTGMATNASGISTLGTRVTNAEGIATQASSDVSTLTSTVNTLSGNVTTVTTTANNAQSTATSALNTANTANGKADTNASAISALDTRLDTAEGDIANFNFTNFTTYGVSDMTKTGTGTLSYGSINVATNSDGSLAKIYGYVDVESMSTEVDVKIQTTLRPESKLTILGLGSSYQVSMSSGIMNIRNILPTQIDIDTDGTVTIPCYKNANSTRTKTILDACVLFIKDFGDTAGE